MRKYWYKHRKSSVAPTFLVQAASSLAIFFMIAFSISLFAFLGNFQVLFGVSTGKNTAEKKEKLVKFADSVTSKEASVQEIKFAAASQLPRNLRINQTRQWPVRGAITTHFNSFHQGIDIAAAYDTPIFPIMKGQITEAKRSWTNLGTYVVIDHGQGWKSLYAHLNFLSVSKGERINLNQKIGSVGTTGYSTGPHLHLETSFRGVNVDPFQILR